MRHILSLIILAACGGAQRPLEITDPDPLSHVEAEELFTRGVALSRAGDYVRAEQYLTAAIDRGYDEEQAMPALLAACVQSSRLSAALTYAEPYLSRHPANWSLRLLVATIRLGMGEPERARDELTRVLEDAPEEPAQAHYFLGVIFRDRLGDVDAAREHFERYLVIAPEGDHAEEARAELNPHQRHIPQRIESHVDPVETTTDGGVFQP